MKKDSKILIVLLVMFCLYAVLSLSGCIPQKPVNPTLEPTIVPTILVTLAPTITSEPTVSPKPTVKPTQKPYATPKAKQTIKPKVTPRPTNTVVVKKGKIVYIAGDNKTTLSKEAFANRNFAIIGSKYFIWVNKSTFRVNIFEKKDSKFVLIKDYSCTIGASSTKTPSGTFKIESRKPGFTSGPVSVKNATRFTPPSFGNYYFHSYLYNLAGTKVVNSTMGQALSHGCIRLLPENAKYIYDNIPNGTVVFIN